MKRQNINISAGESRAHKQPSGRKKIIFPKMDIVSFGSKPSICNKLSEWLLFNKQFLHLLNHDASRKMGIQTPTSNRQTTGKYPPAVHAAEYGLDHSSPSRSGIE